MDSGTAAVAKRHRQKKEFWEKRYERQLGADFYKNRYPKLPFFARWFIDANVRVRTFPIFYLSVLLLPPVVGMLFWLPYSIRRSRALHDPEAYRGSLFLPNRDFTAHARLFDRQRRE